VGNRDQAQPRTNPERGFHSALADLKPERALIAYPGRDRYPLAPSREAIGLAELCEQAKARSQAH
jgi:hypothetical protein